MAYASSSSSSSSLVLLLVLLLLLLLLFVVAVEAELEFNVDAEGGLEALVSATPEEMGLQIRSIDADLELTKSVNAPPVFLPAESVLLLFPSEATDTGASVDLSRSKLTLPPLEPVVEVTIVFV